MKLLTKYKKFNKNKILKTNSITFSNISFKLCYNKLRVKLIKQKVNTFYQVL